MDFLVSNGGDCRFFWMIDFHGNVEFFSSVEGAFILSRKSKSAYFLVI